MFIPTDLGSRCLEKRAKVWRLRTQSLQFGKLPKLMGIVNVTPDSFSDGGKFHGTDQAIEHGLRLAEEGADILDVGGESTRPYADKVSETEELQRVIPVIQGLAEKTRVPISIDTSKARVAREAIQAGAEIINDVTGLDGDPKMLETAVELEAGVCAMHMRGTPQTMQDNPQYEHVVNDIYSYLNAKRDQLRQSGIETVRICLDPGIGFGKTHQHNLELMQQCGTFHQLGCPILVGHSRKGFLAHVMEDKETDRTAATIGSAIALLTQGIQVIRVHDVLPLKQALTLFVACGGITIAK